MRGESLPSQQQDSKPEQEPRLLNEYVCGVDSAWIAVEATEPQKRRIEIGWSSKPAINVTITVLAGLLLFVFIAEDHESNEPLLMAVVTLVLAGIAAQLRLAKHETRDTLREDTTKHAGLP